MGRFSPVPYRGHLAENRFFIRDMDLEMEFRRDNADRVSNLVFFYEGKQVLDVKREH